MLNDKKVIVVIPARSGSKSLPDKNIKLFNGIPLIAHSIILAKSIDIIDEVYVSTDSEKYKEIALKYGALVPFLRPNEISTDESSDYDVFNHFLNYYYSINKNYPEILIHLRPTYPLRSKELLLNTIKLFNNIYEEYDSLRTVIPYEKSLFKMYTITDNILYPTYNKFDNINEPYNQARQILPTTYLHNGCIDILKYTNITIYNSMTGNKIYPYIMNKYCIDDIDNINEFIKAEQKYKLK